MPSAVSKEQFLINLKNKNPEEADTIEILEYTRSKAPTTYRCKICGHQEIIYCAGDLLKKKHLCNQCWYSRGTSLKRKEQKRKALEEINKNFDLKFISFGWNETSQREKIKCSCKKCGLISEKGVESFLKNPICQGCSVGGKTLTTKGIQLLFPKGYTILEDYKGTDKKILVRHEDCGFIWKVTPHDIRSGYGCPKCSKRISKGEKKILEWLNKNQIAYEREKLFVWDGLRRYDFYLPNHKLVIEYMGIQHYKEVPHFGLSLEEQQSRDKWKKEEALKHDLTYLEIPYTEFSNIENILAQRLSRKESRIIEKESILRDEDIV